MVTTASNQQLEAEENEGMTQV